MSFDLKSITRGAQLQPPRMILLGVEKIGKALCVETPIPTPVGWRKLKDINPGNIVFDKNGQPSTVTNTTEIMHGRPCYDVHFQDGSILKADAEHQWEVLSIRDN